ncbi:sulfite exporter TauE/SafE family protein [Citreimonas sp.]|uniref:sulfite exporter TauE/SafE family protein n=1 Tax=Citreimonas sp. TaxID=3036715 RepID=UPI0035C7CD0C
MEILSWSVFLVAVPAVIFAGVSKGGFGSGAAFASASILALVIPPGAALGLMLPLLMLIDVTSLRAYWRRWDWQAGRVLLLGAVPGTLAGAAFYAAASPDAIRLLIGIVSVSFVAWQVARSRGWIRFAEWRPGRTTGTVAGVVVGFTSFVSHAGGPAAAVYLLGRGLSKTAYQATTVLVFWAVNLLKSLFYAGMGIFSAETLLLAAALAPFALLGTWIGIRAHTRVSERLFFGVTYTLLTLTGIRLIWIALT